MRVTKLFKKKKFKTKIRSNYFYLNIFSILTNKYWNNSIKKNEGGGSRVINNFKVPFEPESSHAKNDYMFCKQDYTSLSILKATNFAVTHSLAPLSFHRIRYSKFSLLPLHSRISYTSAYTNSVPSKTLITPLSPAMKRSVMRPSASMTTMLCPLLAPSQVTRWRGTPFQWRYPRLCFSWCIWICRRTHLRCLWKLFMLLLVVGFGTQWWWYWNAWVCGESWEMIDGGEGRGFWDLEKI